MTAPEIPGPYVEVVHEATKPTVDQHVLEVAADVPGVANGDYFKSAHHYLWFDAGQ